MPEHSTIQSANCHEPKHITLAGTSDSGKVITPSSGVAGVSVLRFLALADISDWIATLATLVSLTGVQTLTNKRVTPRVSAVAYAANIGVNTDSFDVLHCASVTANIIVDAPTGTPTNGQRLLVKLTQDTTGGWTITYNSAFVTATASTLTLSTTEMREFVWDSGRSKWLQLAVSTGI